MADQCFVKKDSDPPVCGVHNVRLVEHQTLREGIVRGVGNFTFLDCSRSDQAVDESAVQNSDSKRPAKSE